MLRFIEFYQNMMSEYINKTISMINFLKKKFQINKTMCAKSFSFEKNVYDTKILNNTRFK